MPSYYYDTKRKVHIKTCSCCETEVIGTANEMESFSIFKKTFSESNGSADTADGLQSRCWICNSSKRRSLGVTLELLRDMHQAQEGCCAICSIPISLDRGASNPANVDHNDNTGIVRQLLCGHCNRGIGHFYHKPELLEAAAEYCRRHEVNDE